MSVTIQKIVFATNLTTPRINNLNAKLNPFCHLMALLGAHHILRVKQGKC